MVSFQKISKLSLDLLLENRLLNEKVDLDKLAEICDIDVFYSEAPHDGLSGALLQKDKGRPQILINKDHNSVRKRFTLAHELGHYFLHKGKGDFIDGEKTQVLLRAETDNARASNMEREANHFAASLLMPAVLIKNAWGKFDEISYIEKVKKLKERFNVSESAMRFRLMNLGYFEENMLL